ESDAARRFDGLVSGFVAGGCSDAGIAARLGTQFAEWQAGGAALQSLAQKSSFVKEAAPLSDDLSAVSTIGRAALDAAAQRNPPADDVRAQWTATLTSAAKAKSQLLLMPVGSVKKLVDAVASGGACQAKP